MDSSDAVPKALSVVLSRYGINQSQAARQLDIPRQSFSTYLHGKTRPSRHLLAKAFSLWGPVLEECGLSQPSESPASASPVQMSLFSEDLQGSRVAVRVESKSVSQVELAITIKVA